MKGKIVFWLSLSFIGVIFGRTIYNNNLDRLENYFKSHNTRFEEEINRICTTELFIENNSTHLLNLINFRLSNWKKEDSTSIQLLDSLLTNYSTSDSIEESIYTNQEIVFNFLKRNNSLLLNSKVKIDEDFLTIVADYTSSLKKALKNSPNNAILRHNYYVLSKFYQENNIYYKTAARLQDLVFMQLKNDLYNDSLDIKSNTIKTMINNKNEQFEKIKSLKEKSECRTRIKDSLNNYLTNHVAKVAEQTCLDSLKNHENIDLYFLNKLKSGYSDDEITNSFYQGEYPNLYNKSFKGSINELLKDSIALSKVQKIICEYLPNECTDSQNDKQGSNQDNKDFNKSPSEEKDINDKNPQENEPSTTDEKKKSAMKNEMRDFNKHQQEQKNNSEEKNPTQKPTAESTEQGESKDKYSEDLFKKLEEQNENYQKTKRKDIPYHTDDSKPNW